MPRTFQAAARGHINGLRGESTLCGDPDPRISRQQALVRRRHPVRTRSPVPRHRRAPGLHGGVHALYSVCGVLGVDRWVETRLGYIHLPG